MPKRMQVVKQFVPTLVSVVVFAVCYVVYVNRLVSIDGLMEHFYRKM